MAKLLQDDKKNCQKSVDKKSCQCYSISVKSDKKSCHLNRTQKRNELRGKSETMKQ